MLFLLLAVPAFTCCPGFKEKCIEISSNEECDILQQKTSNKFSAIERMEWKEPAKTPWAILIEKESFNAKIEWCEEVYLPKTKNSAEGRYNICHVITTPQGVCSWEGEEQSSAVYYWSINETHAIAPPIKGKEYRILPTNAPTRDTRNPDYISFSMLDMGCSQ